MQRPQTKDGVFVPRYAAKLLDYFIKFVRPHLGPSENLLSLWVSDNGQPLEGASYNRKIQFAITACFGSGKKITPQIFRRLVPSLIFASDIYPDGVSMKDFIADYARTVGTSEKIMLSYYIRAKANFRNIATVEFMTDNLLMSGEGEMQYIIAHIVLQLQHKETIWQTSSNTMTVLSNKTTQTK